MSTSLDFDWRSESNAVQALRQHFLLTLLRACSRQTEKRVARSQGGLLAWSRYFLPQHFHRPPSAMHREVAELLDEIDSRKARWARGKRRRRESGDATLPCAPPLPGGRGSVRLGRRSARPRGRFDERGCRLNILGPRGSAKSTLVTLAFVLRQAVSGWQPYIWIVSDTKDQAVAHLANLRAELIENRRLRRVYPRATLAAHKGNRIVLRSGTVIEAYGAGQRIRGRRVRQHRPTLIVCDDLQNDGHIYSAMQRNQSRAWFHGTLLKAGTKRTHVVHLGTALHREALAIELHTAPGWTSRRFQAIRQWPTNMHLWSEWEERYRKAPQLSHGTSIDAARQFYELHRAAMQLGVDLLWPEEEDLYTLMCMRAESGGTAFEREKQCVPLNPDECEWPEDYFGDDIWFDEWPSDLRLRTMALDPSKGADARRGDYAAFVMLGVANDGTLFVEANLARRPTPQIVADGVELIRWFRPHVFGIEANQFQSLLAGEFAAEFARHNAICVAPSSIVNTVAKAVRIRRLGPYLAQRKLRFKSNSPGTRLLVDQLREFPLSHHDDGPDALEMAIRLADELSQPTPNDGLGERLI